ncbi:hypothetical protein EYF80_045869 [Liparis tanakae]|uniref:Uncharacterized protein n=1 Tax=Liparis tanakae TaxID=230148 RepID=A0A4Z2FUA2_9TELE|nr:hypothetical protein EYF80_045869 [Liparis tanakae]
MFDVGERESPEAKLLLLLRAADLLSGCCEMALSTMYNVSRGREVWRKRKRKRKSRGADEDHDREL